MPVVRIAPGLAPAGREVDFLRRLVNSNYIPNDPTSSRDLVTELSSAAIVVIEVPPAVPFGIPDHIAVAQHTDRRICILRSAARVARKQEGLGTLCQPLRHATGRG